MDAFNHRFNQKLINLPNLHQIIHYSPLTISPDSCVMDAINLMNQQQDHKVTVNNPINQITDYVVVVEGKQLQGIFTIKDVLRVITLNTDLSAVKMADVMTQPLITLKYSASEHILTVFALLQQHSIQYLPIVDDQDNLIGIVTEANLLQALNIEKMIGVVEALQENLLDLKTEHIPINEQLEVIRKQTHNHLQAWAKKQVDENLEINRELQETLEELQIAEEELRQQNEQLL
jgi:CBS domain-containing protein